MAAAWETKKLSVTMARACPPGGREMKGGLKRNRFTDDRLVVRQDIYINSNEQDDHSSSRPEKYDEFLMSVGKIHG
jgi:hypothetical protein